MDSHFDGFNLCLCLSEWFERPSARRCIHLFSLLFALARFSDHLDQENKGSPDGNCPSPDDESRSLAGDPGRNQKAKCLTQNEGPDAFKAMKIPYKALKNFALSTYGIAIIGLSIIGFIVFAGMWPISVHSQEAYYWQNRLGCSAQEANQIVTAIRDVASRTSKSYEYTDQHVWRIYSRGVFSIQQAIGLAELTQDRSQKTGLDIY
jgi:hypothetical protein